MRVAVTGTSDAFERTAGPLRSAGLMPVSLPCIEIEPVSAQELERIRSLASDADVIVITSTRAAHITWPDGMPDEPPVAVVGAATGTAVERLGGRVGWMGSGGAADLVGRLTDEIGGLTLLFPRGRLADPVTARQLRAAGAAVLDPVVYDTVPIHPGLDPVEAAIFSSPSAVSGWTGTRGLKGLVTAAIGLTTAAALEAAGAARPLVPDRPDIGRLVEMLREYLEVKT